MYEDKSNLDLYVISEQFLRDIFIIKRCSSPLIDQIPISIPSEKGGNMKWQEGEVGELVCGVKLFEKRLKQMLHSTGVTMSCRVCIINQTGPRYEFIRVLQSSNTEHN